MKVLIAGATGVLERRLVQQLRDRTITAIGCGLSAIAYNMAHQSGFCAAANRSDRSKIEDWSISTITNHLW